MAEADRIVAVFERRTLDPKGEAIYPRSKGAAPEAQHSLTLQPCSPPPGL